MNVTSGDVYQYPAGSSNYYIVNAMVSNHKPTLWMAIDNGVVESLKNIPQVLKITTKSTKEARSLT